MNKILLTFLSIILCASLTAQDKAVLRLNPEKNKVYRLRSDTEQTISQTINGNQQTVESNVIYSVSLKMVDATQDFMIMEARFDTITNKTNSMGKTSTFSSTSEGNMASAETADIMSCAMNRLSKSPIYTKMDFTGKPLEVVNARMISDLVLKDTSAITLKGPVGTAIKAQVSSLVGEAALKNMISPFSWTLPAKEVSTGETWVITQQMNSGGMLLDIKTSYRLDKISGNKAMISVESGIRAAENAVPIKSGGATVTYESLQGVSKSKLVLDINTGLVIEDKAETHISGKLGISGPGFNMEMPMDIIGKSTVKAL